MLLVAGCCCITSDRAVPRALYNGTAHGTAAVAHQALPIVMATDGAMCVRMWAVISVDLGSRNERIKEIKNDAISWMLNRGQGDDTKPHFLGVSKVTA